MNIFDQINHVAACAERGEEVMEMAISIGQQASRDGDRQRIAIGTLADILCRRYAEGSLESFAKNISVKARTVRSYRSVVRYYGSVHLCNLLEQGAAWSLLRETAQAFPDQPDAADAFLERALDAHMTIEEAERELALDTGRVKAPSLADALAAKLARLLDAVDGVPELLIALAGLAGDALEHDLDDRAMAKAQAIRDALAGAEVGA